MSLTVLPAVQIILGKVVSEEGLQINFEKTNKNKKTQKLLFLTLKLQKSFLFYLKQIILKVWLQFELTHSHL